MKTADVIVVGLGAMGSAALYQLARRGVQAIGIDRFTPPHEHGSSHGETRITRHATGEGEAYVALAMRSHEIWREIEAETGEELLLECGGLVLSGARSSHPKKAGFLDKTIAAARRYDIPHEVLTASEISDRFPQFILEGDERGYFEPGAGLVFPERCIRAQLDLARRGGATILSDEPVLSVQPDSSGVTVRTGRGDYRAATAIVSAGSWTPGLLPGVLDPMRIYRQVLTWFEVRDPDEYAPGRFPIFIWMHGDAGEQSYGFPAVGGSDGIKVAWEVYEASSPSPEAVDRRVDPREVAITYERHVGGKLRGAGPRVLRTSTCLYTQAPDGAFAIDRHPDSERILVVSACSGHGFKHSAAIGEALSQWIIEERPRLDLSPFALARFANFRDSDTEIAR